ncbi:PadR family transcriptional regulator [Sciscionella marina]|uniref:PadR family transcriptional regulator n=1 Tax=Sciscionella marina TaxID=508770 RepID=UPI0004760409|nr:helix-turn-helix transcriptional regulator [Sciscionella marina]
MSTKLTPMAIAVLELLHERPMHPYEMRRLLRERGAELRVKISAGALYRTVERLTGDGVLEIVETSRDGNRPERTVYAVTGKGRDLFASSTLDMLAVPAEEYPQFALAIDVIADLEPEAVRAALNMRLMYLDNKLASMSVVDRYTTEGKTHRMFLLDHEYRIHMWRAEREWTRNLLDDLETERLTWPENKLGKSNEN